jgi:hypothetical protein
MGACADKPVQDPEILKRIAQIKNDTLPLVIGLGNPTTMPSAEVLRKAMDKGFPAMIDDMEFLDKNLPSSDPDRASVEKYLRALKSAHSKQGNR